MSNLRQLNAALHLYAEQGDGELASLPWDPVNSFKAMGLPDALWHTGGQPRSPVDPLTDVYIYLWPSKLATDPGYLQTWNDYVSAVGGNPVLMIDDTFPGTDDTGPFTISRHIGAFWSGTVSVRHYGGLGQNLIANWR